MSSATHGTTPYYFVPGPSRHPVMAAAGLFFVILGAGQWINGAAWGKYSLMLGMVWWLFVLYQWFRDAVVESEGGQYGRKIDISYRWSMSWFIFSEVMFFGAFFTALWWARSHSVPALGSLENALLWPDFKAVWPSMAAGVTASPGGIVEPFTTMGPFWLPTINTALLLTSGVTLTVAHHALIDGNRSKTIAFMWATVLLGVTFLFVQGYEYYHAYTAYNLKLSSAFAEGSLHPGASLRVRGRRLVLALCRRGVVGPLRSRVLALIASIAKKGTLGCLFYWCLLY
jgi:cytochrome c oxidase subunit 3